MRILYISAANGPDYLCDMIFHGLRTEIGAGVVDAERIWFMYADEFGEGKRERSKLYGRGFTLYGLLASDSDVDRTDLERKIQTKYFDLIVYGSIHRCARFLPQVLVAYPPARILFIDGEDEATLIPQLLGRGIYFKRELTAPVAGVWPIQFAIPEQRIGSVVRRKAKLLAHIDPRDKRTYIYNDEAGYYGDYAESLFGVTMKKAGWDCLRHYEIIANGCIPWFLELEKCPSTTMPFLPKLELLAAKKLLETRGLDFFQTNPGVEVWLELGRRIVATTRQRCTTRAMANYVLETASAWKKN